MFVLIAARTSNPTERIPLHDWLIGHESDEIKWEKTSSLTQGAV
jgi:hypothetical protein